MANERDAHEGYARDNVRFAMGNRHCHKRDVGSGRSRIRGLPVNDPEIPLESLRHLARVRRDEAQELRRDLKRLAMLFAASLLLNCGYTIYNVYSVFSSDSPRDAVGEPCRFDHCGRIANTDFSR